MLHFTIYYCNMTILNVHIDEEDKEKLQGLVDISKLKSMSEAVRKLLSEKIKIEETSKDKKKNQEIEIPDYIPKNKYVGFVRGAIIGVADSVSEIAQIAAEKFPDGPLVIKYNGPRKKPMEYMFMSLNGLKCWKYAEVENITYPIVPITFISNSDKKPLYGLIDTAASLCLIKQDLIDSSTLAPTREEQISTAAGGITSKIFKGKVELLGVEFEIEYILAPIDNSLPFTMLIGRNFLKELDAYFFVF